MRVRVTFVLGLGLGYVLGTRAGRDRFDQLMRSLRSAKEQPAVQEAAGVVAARAGGLVDRARATLGRGNGLQEAAPSPNGFSAPPHQPQG